MIRSKILRLASAHEAGDLERLLMGPGSPRLPLTVRLSPHIARFVRFKFKFCPVALWRVIGRIKGWRGVRKYFFIGTTGRMQQCVDVTTRLYRNPADAYSLPSFEVQVPSV